MSDYTLLHSILDRCEASTDDFDWGHPDMCILGLGWGEGRRAYPTSEEKKDALGLTQKQFYEVYVGYTNMKFWKKDMQAIKKDKAIALDHVRTCLAQWEMEECLTKAASHESLTAQSSQHGDALESLNYPF